MKRTNRFSDASLKSAFRNIAVTATISSVATSATLVICGLVELGDAVQPFNAISHIVWGDAAANMQAVSLKYTAVGLILHVMAMVMWSAFHELVFRWLIHIRPGWEILAGAGVAGIAYLTNYHVVPSRLAPGFEMVLSSQSLFVIFAALGASLALGQGISSGQLRHEASALRR
jgi:hypothetical protein